MLFYIHRVAKKSRNTRNLTTFAKKLEFEKLKKDLESGTKIFRKLQILNSFICKTTKLRLSIKNLTYTRFFFVLLRIFNVKTFFTHLKYHYSIFSIFYSI